MNLCLSLLWRVGIKVIKPYFTGSVCEMDTLDTWIATVFPGQSAIFSP